MKINGIDIDKFEGNTKGLCIIFKGGLDDLAKHIQEKIDVTINLMGGSPETSVYHRMSAETDAYMAVLKKIDERFGTNYSIRK